MFKDRVTETGGISKHNVTSSRFMSYLSLVTGLTEPDFSILTELLHMDNLSGLAWASLGWYNKGPLPEWLLSNGICHPFLWRLEV